MFFVVRGSDGETGRAAATWEGLVTSGVTAVLHGPSGEPGQEQEPWRHLALRMDAGGALDEDSLPWLGDTDGVASCDLRVPWSDESGQALVAVEELAAAVGASGGLLFVGEADLDRVCGDELTEGDRTELAAHWAQTHGLALVLVLSGTAVVAVKGDGRTQELAGHWPLDAPGERGWTVARLLAAYLRCPADLSQGLQVWDD